MSNKKLLLEGLSAPGVNVSVRSLATYMSSNGVLVRPFVGRMRGYIPMPDSAYGIDLNAFTEEGGSFYKDRVSASHLSFIPPADEAALVRLEARLRRAVEARSLAEDFMPIAAYDSLKKEFEKIRQDYFNKRDEILDKWDTLVKDFTQGAGEMLYGINIPQTARDELLKQFIAGIPNKTEYAQSFKMVLTVHAFPAESAVPEGLDSSVALDVKDTWKDEVVSTAILSIEREVGIGWSKMLAAMRQYMKGSGIKSPTIAALTKFARELEWRNVFRNPLLQSLSDTLKNLDNLECDAQADAIEDSVVLTYRYAKETQVNLNMDKSPYTVQMLESMAYVASAQTYQKGA